MQKRPSDNSLFKSVVGAIATFLLVQIIFLLIHFTTWEPNRRESENVVNNLMGLLPEGLFTEFLAPYRMFELNAITFLMAGAMIIVILFQSLSRLMTKS
ncbi:YfzA family protein [Alkalihalobacillus sp. FSL W8-0930]